jgi:hypothetical protein
MLTTSDAHTRRCERKPKTTPVSLVLKGDHHIKSDGSAFTLDVSLNGASVRTKLELAPGEWVGVVPKGDVAYPIPARAVWVREDECKWTYAGLEFLDTKVV